MAIDALCKRLLLILLASCLLADKSAAQEKPASRGPIYADGQGVLRWSKSGKEANFFGVNYTLPFAYGYRSHQRLGIDLRRAIDEDVYHFARLNLDAFRVHIWDVEITDSAGNLLENEHLLLFDYLLARLKERGIRTLLTPIAFWGNGYPEPDEKTPGFSTYYGKKGAVVQEGAIRAQERYLGQLMRHRNPYTGLRYAEDTSIVAMELNNEPVHSGPREGVTRYINRLVRAVRSGGWRKPIFYNISESPSFASAVAAAGVEGHSFQWYPTGLVAGRTQKGNFLPHVHRYHIPFADSLSRFAGRAKVVYEFDAGDIMEPVMYPSMARSFRAAGFQWATQFAYDPLHTAYANTEYQTHYLNLAYTPAKAVSLLIAAKVFHQTPRYRARDPYPADSSGDGFRISYRNALAEYNVPGEFYHTGYTTTQPVQPEALRQLAGVGSSPLVSYGGSGAYFLDRLAEGTWRLELMPDAIPLEDPFGKAAPSREVVRLAWNSQPVEIRLPHLGRTFHVIGLDSGNQFRSIANGGRVSLRPGAYLLTRDSSQAAQLHGQARLNNGRISLQEFHAPHPVFTHPVVSHQSPGLITAGQAHTLSFNYAGVDSGALLSMLMEHSTGVWREVPVHRAVTGRLELRLPPEVQVPGELRYRLLVRAGRDSALVFPGPRSGDPFRWDAVRGEAYSLFIAADTARVPLFNATADRHLLNTFNTPWDSRPVSFPASSLPGQLVYRNVLPPPGEEGAGWQLFTGDRLAAQLPGHRPLTRLVVRGRATGGGAVARVTLVSKDAIAHRAETVLDSLFRELSLPLASFVPDSFLLLPRPYPFFQPLWFPTTASALLRPEDIDRLQVLFRAQGPGVKVELEGVWLE
jgi:hypothetical protein